MNLAQEYLKSHGITEETAELYGITSDKDYLHIPIKDADGEDLFIKSRYLKFDPDGEEPKYKNSINSKATLFNLHAALDASSIVLCEGEIDAIRLMQEGIPSLSSTGGAGTFPEEFVKTLKDKKIYICYDNDKAGKKGTRNVIEHLAKAKVISLPEGVKDVCEFFEAGNNRTEFIKLMKLAMSKIEWEASNLPEEYKLINGQELDAMKIESMPWLIESVLYNEGFCFIYGAEGIGKSFITLSMAKAVATGEPWLDTFKIPNTTNVLFLDLENPLSLTAKRMRGLGGTPKNMYWLRYPNGFSLHNGKGGASDFALAVATLIEEKKIGLVVVDSFVDLMVGSANSAEDTQVFFTALKSLYPGVSFLVLHHENKPSQGTYRNSGQRLRGSTNINAQTFTMFRLEAVAKSKTEMTLEQTKSRDEQKMDKFMLRMEVERNPEEEGKTLVTGFTYLGVVVSTDDKKSAETEELITAALADSGNGSLSRQDLIAFATAGGLSESTFNRTIKDMENDHLVKKIKKGKSVWFTLNDPIVENEIEEGGLF